MTDAMHAALRRERQQKFRIDFSMDAAAQARVKKTHDRYAEKWMRTDEEGDYWRLCESHV